MLYTEGTITTRQCAEMTHKHSSFKILRLLILVINNKSFLGLVIAAAEE